MPALTAEQRKIWRLRQVVEETWARRHVPAWDKLWARRLRAERRFQLTMEAHLDSLRRHLGTPEELARLGSGFRKAYEAGTPSGPDGEIAALISGSLRERLPQDAGNAAYLGMALDIGEEAGETTLENLGLGKTFEWTNPRAMARDMFEVRGSKVIQNAYGTHTDELASIIVRATDPRRPMSTGQVTSEIRDRWGNLTARQAQVIARTETAAVWEATNWHVMKNNGVERVRWLTASGPSIGRENPPCFICMANAAAGYVSIDKAFPSGDKTPPAHPQCRCTLVGDMRSWLPPAKDDVWNGQFGRYLALGIPFIPDELLLIPLIRFAWRRYAVPVARFIYVRDVFGWFKRHDIDPNPSNLYAAHELENLRDLAENEVTDYAIERYTVPEGVTAWRAVDRDFAERYLLPYAPDEALGLTWREGGYTVASLARDTVAVPVSGALVELRLPGQQPVGFLGNGDIALPRGQTYKVVDVRRENGVPVYVVQVERQLPPDLPAKLPCGPELRRAPGVPGCPDYPQREPVDAKELKGKARKAFIAQQPALLREELEVLEEYRYNFSNLNLYLRNKLDPKVFAAQIAKVRELPAKLDALIKQQVEDPLVVWRGLRSHEMRRQFEGGRSYVGAILSHESFMSTTLDYERATRYSAEETFVERSEDVFADSILFRIRLPEGVRYVYNQQYPDQEELLIGQGRAIQVVSEEVVTVPQPPDLDWELPDEERQVLMLDVELLPEPGELVELLRIAEPPTPMPPLGQRQPDLEELRERLLPLLGRGKLDSVRYLEETGVNLDAVDHWLIGGYWVINDLLRGSKETIPYNDRDVREALETTLNLERAIKQAPELTAPVTLFRGIESDETIRLWEEGKLLGTRWRDYGLSATSPGIERIARVFLEGAEEGRVLLEVHALAGTRGLFLDTEKISPEEIAGEMEWLLERGAMYRAISARPEIDPVFDKEFLRVVTELELPETYGTWFYGSRIAQAWLDQNWRPELNQLERTVLLDTLVDTSEDLRRGVDNPNAQVIDEALARNAAPEDVTVWRALSSVELEDIEVGTVFRDRGFPETFVSRQLAEYEEGIAEVRLPEGFSALPGGGGSVVLPRNIAWKVTEIHDDVKGTGPGADPVRRVVIEPTEDVPDFVEVVPSATARYFTSHAELREWLDANKLGLIHTTAVAERSLLLELLRKNKLERATGMLERLLRPQLTKPVALFRQAPLPKALSNIATSEIVGEVLREDQFLVATPVRGEARQFSELLSELGDWPRPDPGDALVEYRLGVEDQVLFVDNINGAILPRNAAYEVVDAGYTENGLRHVVVQSTRRAEPEPKVLAWTDTSVRSFTFDRWRDDLVLPFFDELQEDEELYSTVLHALDEYQDSDGYDEILEVLVRPEVLTTHQINHRRPLIEALDQAFQIAPRLEKDLYVWRGEKFHELELNAKWEERMFVPTSLLRDVAVGFAGVPPKLARIRVPAGTPVLFLDHSVLLNAIRIATGVEPPKEMELVLPRGTRFQVTELKPEAGYAEVEITYVPDVDEPGPIGKLPPPEEEIPEVERFEYTLQLERTDVENDLLSGEITNVELFEADNVSETYTAEVAGSKVMLKPQAGLPDPSMASVGGGKEWRPGVVWGTEVLREKAAYVVSRYLGLGKVPETVIREYEDGPAMVQRFSAGIPLWQYEDVDPGAAEWRELAVFDVVTGQLDRGHEGNVLLLGKKLIPVDHSFSFSASPEAKLDSLAIRHVRDVSIDNLSSAHRRRLEDFVAQRKNVDRDLRAVGITDAEIEAMWARTQRMLDEDKIVGDEWLPSRGADDLPEPLDPWDPPPEQLPEANPWELPPRDFGATDLTVEVGRQQIEAAGSLSEINDVLGTQYEILTEADARFDLTGVNLALARRFALAINEMVGRYPFLLAHLARVDTMILDEGTYADTSTPDGTAVRLNVLVGKTPAAWEMRLLNNVRDGFHPWGTEAPESVVYHELAHVLEFAAEALWYEAPRIGKPLDELWDGIFTKLADYAGMEEVTNKELRLFYTTLGRNRLNVDTRDEIEAFIETELSYYASTNRREFLAEAMTEYLTSSNPRRVARLVGQAVDDLYREIEVAPVVPVVPTLAPTVPISDVQRWSQELVSAVGEAFESLGLQVTLELDAARAKDGINANTANVLTGWVSGLYDVAARFPRVFDPIRKIKITVGRDYLGKAGKTYVEFSFPNSSFTTPAYLRWLTAQVEGEIFPPGTAVKEATAVHEAGHVFHNAMIEKLSPAAYDKFLRELSEEILAEVPSSTVSQDALYRFLTIPSDPKPPWSTPISMDEYLAIRSYLTRHLGTYGSENGNEFFATAFMEYIVSPTPRPLARVVGQKLSEWYSDTF